MSYTNVISYDGGWEGYRVVKTTTLNIGSHKYLQIELIPASPELMLCPECGEQCTGVHETTKRIVRDLPILDARTTLIVHCRRLLCRRCGTISEKVLWLERYARVTIRLAQSVAKLCQVLPIKQVAEHFGLSWDQVKEIDKRYLHKRFDTVDLTGIEVIGMDEFALRKGHHYATVIVEPRRKEVLFVAEGRSRASIRPFFTALGVEGCQRLKAAVMDMNGAFEVEVKAHCPQAAIVYDLFHVVAKYSREVLDPVRNTEANRVKDDNEKRKVIRTARWLLLRNNSDLKSEERVRLQELLDANHNLFTVYLLKDDLKQLWRFNRVEEAKPFWEQWYQRALESKIPKLKNFATKLLGYVEGIFNHCLWPLHTGILEGINNKIKVMKRMAYGYRDHEYFFLKIKAAFPGIPR